MDIGSYKAVTKPLAVDFGGEVINLSYRENIYTLGFQRRLFKALDEQSADLLAESFGELIASWDLLEDGQPVPLTPEGVERVPLPILAAVDRAIGDALEVPGEDEKRGSSEPAASPPQSSTPPTQSSPPAPENGSTTTPSPTVSESPSTS